MKLLGIISVDLDIIDGLLIRYSVLSYTGENWSTRGQYISYLQILTRPMNQSGKKYLLMLSVNLLHYETIYVN
jgi:hypothetical protein